MSSRSVSLTSTFLLLAAGGAAACDRGTQYRDEGFYCADENGVVVDEDLCDEDSSRNSSSYRDAYIYQATGSSYRVGQKLPSGSRRFSYSDRSARTAAGLSATGRIGNGTRGYYCADSSGVVIDENSCDPNTNRFYSGGGSGSGYHGGGYYIYHSPNYRSGYSVGQKLPSGGSRFAYNDSARRSSFGLPSSGRIGNGTVKSSVVGKGGSGSRSSSKSGG